MSNLEENVSDKNKKMMMLIIGLLVVLIGVIIAVAIFIITTVNSDNIVEVSYVQPNILTPADLTLIPLSQPINTNLITGVEGRERVASLNFSVAINHNESDSEELITVIKRSEPIIRDIALNVLRDRTAAEINSREGPHLISSEILMRLQDEFQSNLIVNVYIVDVFVQ